MHQPWNHCFRHQGYDFPSENIHQTSAHITRANTLGILCVCILNVVPMIIFSQNN
jgi:hypothetical protein